MKDCCRHLKKDKKCRRGKDKKVFTLPRKFSKEECKNPKGFTMKSSCAPYKDCLKSKRVKKKRVKKKRTINGGKRKGGSIAYFAGGCFWGIEEAFSKLKGVLKTKVGYMGGHVKNPTYKQVSNGNTGHSETVMVEYDNKIISYKQLLDVFFKIHDPKSFDKQGYDEGPQYRAIVFYNNVSQLNDYNDFLRKYDKESIKTQIQKKKEFFIAEDKHQKKNLSKRMQ